MEEESKTKFSMNVEFSFSFKSEQTTLAFMIDKSRGRRYYDDIKMISNKFI